MVTGSFFVLFTYVEALVLRIQDSKWVHFPSNRTRFSFYDRCMRLLLAVIRKYEWGKLGLIVLKVLFCEKFLENYVLTPLSQDDRGNLAINVHTIIT